MSRATFFLRECPTCGRNLQIRVQYLGRLVRCPHCSGQFEAHDPDVGSLTAESSVGLLERADELLAGSETSRAPADGDQHHLPR